MTEKSWKWAPDDAPINIQLAWGPGEPNNLNGKENCLDVYKGTLNACSIEGKFVCQRSFEEISFPLHNCSKT